MNSDDSFDIRLDQLSEAGWCTQVQNRTVFAGLDLFLSDLRED